MTRDNERDFRQASSHASNLVSPIKTGVKGEGLLHEKGPVKGVRRSGAAHGNSQPSDALAVHAVLPQVKNLMRVVGRRRGKNLKKKVLRSASAQTRDEMQ